MKLSRLTDYAIIIMAAFARRGDMSFSAQVISGTTGLPLSTVSKLLKKLMKYRLLTSTQGAKGGYKLARSPSDITVADIIVAIDGPIEMTLCAGTESDCSLESSCAVKFGLKRINNIILQELRKVTLAEIIRPAPYHTQLVQRESV